MNFRARLLPREGRWTSMVSRCTPNLSRRTGRPPSCRLSVAPHVTEPPQNTPLPMLTHHQSQGRQREEGGGEHPEGASLNLAAPAVRAQWKVLTRELQDEDKVCPPPPSELYTSRIFATFFRRLSALLAKPNVPLFFVPHS